jgi:hypothetical protein
LPTDDTAREDIDDEGGVDPSGEGSFLLQRVWHSAAVKDIDFDVLPRHSNLVKMN